MRRTNGRGPRTRRRLSTTVLLLALTPLLSACSGEQSMLDPEGPFARDPDNLFMLVIAIAAVIFVLVQGLIIYTVWKYRQRTDDEDLPVQTHGNTRLEIMWTVIPALILAGIAVPTVQQVFSLSDEPDGALTVEVIGHRWWWEFRYPDAGVITANELVMPVDRPVRLQMRSEENGNEARGVIHSFWIPALAGKQDVIPGRVTTLNMQADTTGRFLGMCTEFCGLSHANMRQRAVVLEQDEFDQWLADQQEPSVQPADGSVEAEGKELFANNCAACHQIRDEAVASADDFLDNTGPDLTHLMSRSEFAGAIFDLYLRDDDGEFTDQPDLDQLEAWLRNPTAEKAMRPEDGIGMPNLNLTEDEIDRLVAYLITLE